MLEKLNAALNDTSDVYVNAGADAAKYFEKLRQDIRRHQCEPYRVTAKVMPPGFPDVELGSELSGLCVAKRDGYWLVYAPESDKFYCFWGTDEQHLGAHGVFGSPLYCWSA
ncbi:MAG: hypothetical protein WBO23_06085 [Burkholderiales bacterium]